VIERIASDPELVEALGTAHAQARRHAWALGAAPERATIDLDATLLQSHSEKEGAAGNFKGGFGFHPLLAYFDESAEAAAAMMRPGNAGANTAADQIAVAEAALEQIPRDRIEAIEVLLRVDSAGASHQLLDWAREGRIRFSVDFDLTEAVREAVLALPEGAWSAALCQDGLERPNGQVAEITERLDLSGWPEGARDRPPRAPAPRRPALLHRPGRFTDQDGHRFQAILTDQPDPDVAALERRHRARARVEDRIRDDKDTGLAKLPFRSFDVNAVWLELVLIAHDLLVWTKALLFEGEFATREPKRLRYRNADSAVMPILI